MSSDPSDLRDQPDLRHLRHLFRYHSWANREVLNRLGEGTAPDRGVALMAHVVGADRLWLDRLHERTQREPVWPGLTLEQCRAALGGIAGEWQALLGGLDDAALSQPCSYVNTKGESWSSATGDVLLHVLLHGAYHRGQVASAVRAAGGEPAYTDYIHAVRRGFVASGFDGG